MKLTLCVITKNEEENIKKCIESVKNLVDDIVIVDTGSTDNTIEVSKSLGAKVYEFTWIDDFSTHALSKVGFADLSIIKDYEKLIEKNPKARVYIWSKDKHLSCYDTGLQKK